MTESQDESEQKKEYVEKVPTMDDFRVINAIIIGTVLLAVTIVSAVIWIAYDSIWLAAAFFAVMFGGFLINGIVRADPENSEVIIPIVREKLVNETMGPGWFFVALKGLFFLDFMRLFCLNFSTRFSSTNMLPDKKEIMEPIVVNWTIDPRNPVPFIKLGQSLEERRAEVDRRLNEQIDQRLREWLCSVTEGPLTLQQAWQMKDEETLAILEKLCGDSVKHLHPDISNEVIIGFLKKMPFLGKEAEMKLEMKKRFSALSLEAQAELLKGAKENLITLVTKARNGQATFHILSLGIIVTRLGIGNIEPTKETRDGMLSVSKSEWDADAQTITGQNVADVAKILTSASPVPIDAVQTAMILRKAIPKTITVTQFDLSPNVTDAIREIGVPLFQDIAGKLAGRKEKKNGSSESGGGNATTKA